MERDQARCDSLFWSVIFISTIANAAWCFSTNCCQSLWLIKAHSDIKWPNEKCSTSNNMTANSFKCFVHIKVLSFHNKHLLTREKSSRAFSYRSHYFQHILIFFSLNCLPWGKCRAELIESPLNPAFLHTCLHRQGMNVIQCCFISK